MKEDTCVLCKTVMDRVMVCKEEDIRYDLQIYQKHEKTPRLWDRKLRLKVIFASACIANSWRFDRAFYGTYMKSVMKGYIANLPILHAVLYHTAGY